MPMLEQQELVEAPPARRMIVPPGADAHCGVDVSTRAVSIATVLGTPENGLERLVVSVPFMELDGGRRLAHAFGEIRSAVTVAVLNRKLHTPGFVFVEQPGSSSINWPLAYMVGVAQAAVFQGFANAGHGPVVETVPPSRWKKLACGFGALPKPTKKVLGRRPEFEDYRVAVWARELGYTGSSWDEADATGVAEAARRTIALEVR